MKKYPINYLPVTPIKCHFDDILSSQFLKYFSYLSPSPSSQEMSRYMLIHRMLYEMSGAEYNNYSLENIKFHITKILQLVYNYSSDGFVDKNALTDNGVISIFRTIYPELEYLFNSGFDENPKYLIFILHHLNNIVILLLLIDSKIATELFRESNANSEDDDDDDDELLDHENNSKSISSRITPGVRRELTRRRLTFFNKIYSGFDTEYQTLEFRSVDVICYSMATYSVSYLRYCPLKVDYTIDAEGVGISQLPANLSRLIEHLINLYRNIDGKCDNELEVLKDQLDILVNSKELERITTVDGPYYSLHRNKDEIFKEFEPFYSEEVSNYSFSELVTRSIDLAEGGLTAQYQKLQSYVSTFLNFSTQEKRRSQRKTDGNEKVSSFRRILNFTSGETGKKLIVPCKLDLTLVSHYSPADVATLADFKEYLPFMSLVRKSFVTTSKPLRISGLDVHLRDTNLLSVTPSSSLAAIGKLYAKHGLEKIDIPKEKYTDMRSYSKEDPIKFQAYAIMDSVVSLYHSLQVEHTNYLHTKRLGIPLTISSLAGKILEVDLLKEGYALPTKNGKYNVGPKLYTSKGVNLSGGLADYLYLFLGSYRGGRNESFKYGVLDGEFFDYDITGAYPTAMAMLQYPDYEKMIKLSNVTLKVCDLTSTLKTENFNFNPLTSYSSFRVNFAFRPHVKYPNLPVSVGEGNVIFPLSGDTYCTGVELLLALRLGCTIEVIEGIVIPFKRAKSESKSESKSDERVTFTSDEVVTSFIDDLSSWLKEEVNKIKIKGSLQKSEDLWAAKSIKTDSVPPETHVGISNCKIESGLVALPPEEQNDDKTYETSKISHHAECEATENLTDDDKMSNFFMLVRRLVVERNKFEKYTFNNEFYKLLANAGIGQIGRGLGGKTVTDVNLTKVVLPPGVLSNPLYAGWITAYIRTVLSELLNWIGSKNVLISCTTDGFITDLKGLENFTLEDYSREGLPFSAKIAEYRQKLGFPARSLELKNTDPKGIIAIKTRGQLGLDSRISALTGFNKFLYSVEELREVFIHSLKGERRLRFPATRLLSGIDIVKKGGNVTMLTTEQDYRLHFDIKRRVVNIPMKGKYGVYYDTIPFPSVGDQMLEEGLDNLETPKYSKRRPWSSVNLLKDVDTYQRVFIRNLVRLFHQQPERFNAVKVSRSEIQEEVLRVFGKKISPNYISRQKRSPFLAHSVVKTAETLQYAKLLCDKYKALEISIFLSK